MIVATNMLTTTTPTPTPTMIKTKNCENSHRHQPDMLLKMKANSDRNSKYHVKGKLGSQEQKLCV